MHKLINEDILNSVCNIIVQYTNCDGIDSHKDERANKYKARYPNFYKEYKSICEEKLIQLGKVHAIGLNSNKYIVNLPIKERWTDNTTEGTFKLAIQGLEQFIRDVGNISTIAIPIPNCTKTKLTEDMVLSIFDELETNLPEVNFYVYTEE